MRRLLPVLVLAACGTPAEEFDEAYLEAWCLAFDAHCGDAVRDDACRASGTPSSTKPATGITGTNPTTLIGPPAPEGCTYHPAKVVGCLDVDAWTCEPGADGQRRLVDPSACGEVWTCE